MSYIKQIETEKDGEVKRMCVYSERDFDYMVSKGWRAVQPPATEPAKVQSVPVDPVPAKRRGRPAKVTH